MQDLIVIVDILHCEVKRVQGFEDSRVQVFLLLVSTRPLGPFTLGSLKNDRLPPVRILVNSTEIKQKLNCKVHINRGKKLMNQGFKDSRGQGFQNSKAPGFKGSRVQVFLPKDLISPLSILSTSSTLSRSCLRILLSIKPKSPDKRI